MAPESIRRLPELRSWRSNTAHLIFSVIRCAISVMNSPGDSLCHCWHAHASCAIHIGIHVYVMHIYNIHIKSDKKCNYTVMSNTVGKCHTIDLLAEQMYALRQYCLWFQRCPLYVYYLYCQSVFTPHPPNILLNITGDLAQHVGIEKPAF